MNKDVFSSLAKYGSSVDENYLTEALVFVTNLLLERKHAIGLDVVNLLCGQHRDSCFDEPKSVLISTQVTTDTGRPDIEIKGKDTLVYIEVKHDSPLGPDQLERYKAQLNESDFSNTQLVLLARSRNSTLETSLQPGDYYRIYWYEIYNWLSETNTQDDVCQYFVKSLMSFLEEKRMSMKRVGWEYIKGIPALLNLTDMIETAITEVMPGAKLTRTAGWNWRGFYLPDNYWFGVRYVQPLVVTFENNRGYTPVTYKCDLNLEGRHFFSLNKDEQFECLVEFLRQASESAPEVSQDVGAGE